MTAADQIRGAYRTHVERCTSCKPGPEGDRCHIAQEILADLRRALELERQQVDLFSTPARERLRTERIRAYAEGTQ